MGEKLQEFLDKEKLTLHRNNLKKFNGAIRKDNDKLLKEYFEEFSAQEKDSNVVEGAYKFLEWIIENK